MLVKGMKKDEAVATARELLEKVGLCATAPTTTPRRSRAARSSAWPSPARWPWTPVLMLFDEPTSALDPELIGEVLKVMKDLAEAGMTMIVVTPRDGLRPRRGQARASSWTTACFIEQDAPENLFFHPEDERTQAVPAPHPAQRGRLRGARGGRCAAGHGPRSAGLAAGGHPRDPDVRRTRRRAAARGTPGRRGRLARVCAGGGGAPQAPRPRPPCVGTRHGSPS